MLRVDGDDRRQSHTFNPFNQKCHVLSILYEDSAGIQRITNRIFITTQSAIGNSTRALFRYSTKTLIKGSRERNLLVSTISSVQG